ncbi:MAG: C_GCAxxG_C_C family protein [Coprobacter sp.]|nr:C_GCAxxG_C_C family protein [Coprobacter sp.]
MEIDVAERTERAKAFFLQGYNCSQAVFLAYCDLFGIEASFGAKLVAPLGGGMGRLREVCGAVSASFLVAGLKFPADRPADTPEGRAAKARNYAVVQELAARFEQENGSLVCRELLNLTCKHDTSEPSERTENYYRRRPCIGYIMAAARIVGEKLKETD